MKTYLLNTRKFNDENLFMKYYSLLSEERKRKVNRFYYQKDKLLSLGAGVLLDYGLKEYGLRGKDVKLDYNKYGKPYLKDYNEIHFNISHSGEYAICSFDEREIGVDIEKVSQYNIKLAEKMFSKSEVQTIKSYPISEQNREFCRIWSLKESYIKLIGKGLSLSLNSFEIITSPTVFVRGGENKGNYFFYQDTISDKYCISICSHKNNISPIIDIEDKII